MTIPASVTCTRCSWTNPAAERNCRGCGQPLLRVSHCHGAGPDPARGASAPPDHTNTITGVVASAPQTVDMIVVQPFWFIVVTVMVLFGSVLLHQVVMPALLLLLVLTLLVHMISGRRRGTGHLPTELIGTRVISNASRRAGRGHGIITRRPGQQIRITAAERTWTVRFLSASGTDLLMGDLVRVEGRRGVHGDFHVIRIINQRTGTTRWSQQLVSSLIVAVCLAVVALHFLP
ncbi:hypothetical protein [Nocardia sp. NPDC050412]|uniref:hypothetical protein n=1 Tax=Nocardia sp. NPDC050412 TaxID=3364320 RepID=UPI00378ED0A2